MVLFIYFGCRLVLELLGFAAKIGIEVHEHPVNILLQVVKCLILFYFEHLEVGLLLLPQLIPLWLGHRPCCLRALLVQTLHSRRIGLHCLQYLLRAMLLEPMLDDFALCVELLAHAVIFQVEVISQFSLASGEVFSHLIVLTQELLPELLVPLVQHLLQVGDGVDQTLVDFIVVGHIVHPALQV